MGEDISERLVRLERLIEGLTDILEVLDRLDVRVQRLEDAISLLSSRQNERIDEVLRTLDDRKAAPQPTERSRGRGL